MNDHDKFDDYIKGLFDKEPKVPAELNWEEMEFDLPEPEKQSDKPDRKKYLGLLLLLLIAVAVVYFSIEKEKIAKHQAPIETVEQFTENKPKSNANQHTTSNHIQAAPTSNDSQKGIELSDEKIISNPTIRTIKSKNKAVSKPKSAQEKTSSSAINNSLPVIISDKINQLNIINSKDDVLGVFSNTNTSQIAIQTNNNTSYKSAESPSSSPIDETKTPQKSIQLSIENLSTIPINILPVNNKIELISSPALSKMDDENNESKIHLEEVFVGYGLNNFNAKVEESNILKDKVTEAVGNSMSAGARFYLNDNWRANIQLKYDRYHSTFEHIRALDTLYRDDGNRLFRVYRYEETFHNNYTNTLGLQFGVERKWQVTERLQLYAGIGFIPTYAFSVNGKTTADTVVDKLVFDNQTDKFSVSGSASAGLIIPINKSINIEAAYQYNRFFLNDIFINNGIQANQQNTISLMISYRLARPAN